MRDLTDLIPELREQLSVFLSDGDIHVCLERPDASAFVLKVPVRDIVVDNEPQAMRTSFDACHDVCLALCEALSRMETTE